MSFYGSVLANVYGLYDINCYLLFWKENTVNGKQSPPKNGRIEGVVFLLHLTNNNNNKKKKRVFNKLFGKLNDKKKTKASCRRKQALIKSYGFWKVMMKKGKWTALFCSIPDMNYITE